MNLRPLWHQRAAGLTGARVNEIIYQVYPASFADANGDGQGDLAGITAKLPYIKALGVDAVWVSPFFLSPAGPEGDGGYAVTDYRAVDPKFGTLSDYRDLLVQAHRLGLRVYNDFVLSHTASNHAWFEKSRNREPGYEDFYVWSDTVPNNWMSAFGGPAWTFDEKRGQYYLHHFLPTQPALNLHNPAAQNAVLADMKFWLDLGTDGFRLDALHFAVSDLHLRDDIPLVAQPKTYKDFRMVHSMNAVGTRNVIARIRALFDSYPRRITGLGEVLCGMEGGRQSIEMAAQFTRGDKGLDCCYTGDLLNIKAYPTAAQLGAIIADVASNFTDGGHCAAFSNHDRARMASRLTSNLPVHQHAAAVDQMMKLLFMLPGSICLYQGDELSLPQADLHKDIGLDNIKDPVRHTRGLNYVRDGSRTPMPWNDAYVVKDYLPIPASHEPLAPLVQDYDPASPLNAMRERIAWYKSQPALSKGDLAHLKVEGSILSFERRCAEQTLVCTFNISDRPMALDGRVMPAFGVQVSDKYGIAALPQMRVSHANPKVAAL